MPSFAEGIDGADANEVVSKALVSKGAKAVEENDKLRTTLVAKYKK